MKNKIISFKDLDVWKKSILLVKKVYLATDKFPKGEEFGLKSQMRRSAISIPSNIAEGYHRGTRAEYKNFLYYAYGSSAELETQLIIANELGYIKDESLFIYLTEILRMLNGLINALKNNTIS